MRKFSDILKPINSIDTRLCNCLKNNGWYDMTPAEFAEKVKLDVTPSLRYPNTYNMGNKSIARLESICRAEGVNITLPRKSGPKQLSLSLRSA